MVLTDGQHLATDRDLNELHQFAGAIGLARSRFQNHRIPHYDILTATMLDRAYLRGVYRCTARYIVMHAKRRTYDDDIRARRRRGPWA